MSLDVYLTLKGIKCNRSSSGVFIREDGQNADAVPVAVVHLLDVAGRALLLPRAVDVIHLIRGVVLVVGVAHVALTLVEEHTKEISRAEWNEKFPGREPVVVNMEDDDVYSANITHNLNRMASEAGIYRHLWRPDEINVSKASELIEPLREGLALLESDPERFKQFNPSNGWGTYEGLVAFVRDYLEACVTYPDADVSVWR